MFSLPAVLVIQLPLWSLRIRKGLRGSQAAVCGNNKRLCEGLGLQGDKTRSVVGDSNVKLASADPESFLGCLTKFVLLVIITVLDVGCPSVLKCVLCDGKRIESHIQTGAREPEGKDSDSCCAPANLNKSLR